MDLTFTPEQEALRTAAREWLDAHVPPEPLASMDTALGFAAHRAWEKKLSDARWSVVHWPEEFGGRGAGILEWLIFEEEYYASGAPGRVSQNGIFLLAPTIFEFGTEEQKLRWLPTMASGERIWAQGWSEPDSGSDLASLRSKATKVDGGWRVDGQKTWCSRAAYADMLFGLFRTDPDSTRHHGLSYLIVPLHADGVTVRPIRQLDGEAGFAEVFFDHVFVPDEDLLGEVGEGWKVAMSTTGSERGLMLRSPGRFLAAADRLVQLRDRLGDVDPTIDADVDRCWLDAQAYRDFVWQTATRLLEGETIGAESSANKLFWSDLDIRIHDTALRMLGERSVLVAEADSAADGGRWLDGYEFSLAGPIYAGTNEIQRNLIAERLLGLPR